MTTEIKKGAIRTLTLEPPSRWTGAISAVVEDDQGETLESPSPTADAVDTTVATDPDNSTSTFKLASIAGVTPGRVYEVTSDAWGVARAKVAQVDDDAVTVTLVEALPGIPEAGDAVRGVEVSVPISTTTTAAAGMNKRLILTSGEEEVLEVIHVVLHPFQFPITAREIRDYVAENWPSHPRRSDEAWIGSVRDEADEELRGRLSAAHRYAHAQWDPRALRLAARPMYRLVLASRKLVPGSWSASDFRDAESREFERRLSDLLKSIDAYDVSGNGKVDVEDTSTGAVIDLTR